ncbi:MAG: ParB/RepB/Spo0J family partition protein [candidate division Zixibacteria bacterium]|nr:ParB/RepB/Spo0J family partition protein [candidate division Zixibacteria bacterium]
MSKLVLGKGLGALIPTEDPSAATTASAGNYRMVALDQIQPNPMQPRHEFDSERLSELADSLKTNGMMQPLVVKQNGSGFILIAGERRFRAAKIAGLTQVPVIINAVDDDVRMLELALVENIQREDLNPLELAVAYRRLIDQCGLTQQDLSTRVNKSRTAVTNTLRLLTLPASVQEMVRRGELTEGHARAILSLASEHEMIATARRIIDGGMSVRATEEVATRIKKRRLVPKRKIPAISEIETYLKHVLGTSVKITPGLKRGRIEIEYYGDDDLERLVELFRTMTA